MSLKLSLYTRSPPLYTALPLVARIAHVHQTLLSNCARRDRSAHVPPFRFVRSVFFFFLLWRVFLLALPRLGQIVTRALPLLAS